MVRFSFKPDSSFFRKIVVGAVGARAVVNDLRGHGHRFIELERGSTDTKLWKDIKRKRVRIPDLLCVNCGRRIECRAKTKLELAMSHSPTDAERAWDFGMVDTDWLAFPVCEATDETDWSSGALSGGVSYWREKGWVRWQAMGTINYFTVKAFRSMMHARSRTKGVEEGSENVIAWDATFSTRDGVVETVDRKAGKVAVKRNSDGHKYTWSIGVGQHIVVVSSEDVGVNQVLASAVQPISDGNLHCANSLPSKHIERLLRSRERTQRFTGLKLARLTPQKDFVDQAKELMADNEEDMYVRLEAASYLASIGHHNARSLFDFFLNSPDEQTQLESVIALGETATDEAVEVLAEIIAQIDRPFFLRSAAAWSLSRTGSETANHRLIRCFGDVDISLREEALDGLVAIGGNALPALFAGLNTGDENVAAGCAEVLRRRGELPKQIVDALIAQLNVTHPQPWALWLIGHLPREQFATAIASLQERRPELHFAISLLWSFVESWIARNWELRPNSIFPQT